MNHKVISFSNKISIIDKVDLLESHFYQATRLPFLFDINSLDIYFSLGTDIGHAGVAKDAQSMGFDIFQSGKVNNGLKDHIGCGTIYYHPDQNIMEIEMRSEKYGATRNTKAVLIKEHIINRFQSDRYELFFADQYMRGTYPECKNIIPDLSKKVRGDNSTEQRTEIKTALARITEASRVVSVVRQSYAKSKFPDKYRNEVKEAISILINSDDIAVSALKEYLALTQLIPEIRMMIKEALYFYD